MLSAILQLGRPYSRLQQAPRPPVARTPQFLSSYFGGRRSAKVPLPTPQGRRTTALRTKNSGWTIFSILGTALDPSQLVHRPPPKPLQLPPHRISLAFGNFATLVPQPRRQQTPRSHKLKYCRKTSRKYRKNSLRLSQQLSRRFPVGPNLQIYRKYRRQPISTARDDPR